MKDQSRPDPMISHLSDPDMQAVPVALARAAQRAREIARQTGTALVIVRDGVLVEEPIADQDNGAAESRDTVSEL